MRRSKQFGQEPTCPLKIKDSEGATDEEEEEEESRVKG